MIKIRIEKEEIEFEDNLSAMKHVAELAKQTGQPEVRFQLFSYKNGQLETMDYLTYKKGRVSNTYNVRY